MANPNLPIKGDYNVYVGARYVPVAMGLWDKTVAYEPLMIVMSEAGDTYVSKTFVPAGTPLTVDDGHGVQVTNTEYWIQTADFNLQVDYYRKEVLKFKTDIDQSEAEYTENFQKEFDNAVTELNADYKSFTDKANEDYTNFTNETNGKYDSFTSETNKNYTEFTDEVNQKVEEYKQSTTDTNENLTNRFNEAINGLTPTDSEIKDARYSEYAKKAYLNLEERLNADFGQALHWDTAYLSDEDLNNTPVQTVRIVNYDGEKKPKNGPAQQNGFLVCYGSGSVTYQVYYVYSVHPIVYYRRGTGAWTKLDVPNLFHFIGPYSGNLDEIENMSVCLSYGTSVTPNLPVDTNAANYFILTVKTSEGYGFQYAIRQDFSQTYIRFVNHNDWDESWTVLTNKRNKDIAVFGDSWADYAGDPSHVRVTQTLERLMDCTVHEYAYGGTGFDVANGYDEQITVFQNDDTWNKTNLSAVILVFTLNEMQAGTTAASCTEKLHDWVTKIRAVIGDKIPIYWFSDYSVHGNTEYNMLAYEYKWINDVREGITDKILAIPTFGWINNHWNPANWFHPDEKGSILYYTNVANVLQGVPPVVGTSFEIEGTVKTNAEDTSEDKKATYIITAINPTCFDCTVILDKEYIADLTSESTITFTQPLPFVPSEINFGHLILSGNQQPNVTSLNFTNGNGNVTLTRGTERFNL